MANNIAYRAKVLLRKVSSVGLSPSNWLFELGAWLIRRDVVRFMIPQYEQMLDERSANSRLKKFMPAQQTEEFSFALSVLKDNPEQIKQCLAENGIAIIHQFVSEDTAIAAGLAYQQYLSSAKFKPLFDATSAVHIEESEYLGQIDYAWSNNYQQIAQQSKPVINIRSRDQHADDAGMVDVFGVDRFTELKAMPIQTVMESLTTGRLAELLRSVSGYPQRQTNLYMNHGVGRTRGPHIDNNQAPFKAFIYLTDCRDEKNGPYCYLPKSPADRRWMSFERLKNAVLRLPNTEVSSFPREKMMKIQGAAGTLIVTNQSGIHCGWPQAEDGKRLMLVSSYY